MRVHVLADNFVRHAAVSTMLAKHCALTSELLDRASIRERDIDAIVVAADLSIMDNISTLKAVSAKLTHVAKRIFLIDRRGRLSVVQAYALGATHVLANPVSGATSAGDTRQRRSRRDRFDQPRHVRRAGSSRRRRGQYRFHVLGGHQRLPDRRQGREAGRQPDCRQHCRAWSVRLACHGPLPP